MSHVSRYRTKSDGTLVCENPISDSVQEAIALADEARATTQKQYRDLLTKLALGKRPHPVKLTRLVTALGKSETDLAADVEVRAAEMEDEAETARCKEQKAALQKQIEEAESTIKDAEIAQTKSSRKSDLLKEEIAAIHARVALEEKADLARALNRNREATATIQRANDTIRALQNRIADLRPKCNHVAQLKMRNARFRREAQERRDLAEARPYLEPDLPRGEIAAIVSPKAHDDDSDQHPNERNERKIPLGCMNGETTFATVKLG